MKKPRLQPAHIFVICLLVGVLVVSALLLVRLLRSFQPTGTGPQADASQSDGGDGSTAPSRPGTSQVEDFPPSHTYGALTLYYDEAQLTETTAEDGRVTLLPASGEEVPRLDFQQLDVTLESFDDEELQRFAVGLLQAYYIDAPETASVEVAADEVFLNAFSLTAPAQGEVPAMTARVRFLQDGSSLWYMALLQPSEGASNAALQLSYETAWVNR